MRVRGSLLGLGALVAAGLWPGGAGAACGGFENPCRTPNDFQQQFVVGADPQRQDTPNDPNYDEAEPDHNPAHGPASTNFYDERFDLFGFPSALTPGAVYRDGTDYSGASKAGKPMVAGFNASGAWKLERGRPDVTIAILDTGIKWNEESLRTQVHLNTGEVPYPKVTGPPLDPSVNCATYDTSGTTYDPDRDGGANVLDYACDPRVSITWPGRSGPSGKITAQDLIHRFGNCKITDHQIDSSVGCPSGGRFDNDGNGYANDIAGWNFFDNNNDPTDLSSYFAAKNHGSGRANDAVERGNDGQGSIGVCPHCEFMPIRVWDTFVSDGNTFGLGIAYATDNGAKVIEGADGSLDHTAFAEAASQYAHDHGVVQTFSGDDLNTANHNYPANYSHAMLIQGTVPDTQGLGTNASNELTLAAAREGISTNLPVGTFFRGANTTQYGGKSSISMTGSTGSINTGLASGAAGLVVSAGLNHGMTLTPDEVRELLEQTAERITTANTLGSGTPDPGADPSAPPDKQWTSHFGWGRADVGRAVGAVAAGNIPPEAAIDAPDWYAPLTGASVDITGLARANRVPSHACHWKLMWGPGFPPSTSPTDTWRTVREGDCSSPVADFGSINLDEVRSVLSSYVAPPDTGGPAFSPSSPNPFQQQFTVQLEVSAPGVMTGIDRRVFTTVPDPTLRSGYPRRMGTGGEAPLRYADLSGDNVPELIVPTEDGTVHAYEPNGSELPGWPVHTQTQAAALGHERSPALSAIAAPREPPRAPVIADLEGNGYPDVITAAGTHIYAWRGDGTPVAGFPVSSNPAFCGPALESQQGNGSHPKCGFLATPAVAHLEGYDKPPDIVASSLDGHLYAFRADGSPVPGYPVALVDPAQLAARHPMIAESINDPAIGSLSSPRHDDVVVATNETYGAPPAGSDVSFNGALAGAAGGSARLYAIDGSTGHFLPGWPISVPGAIQDVLPLVGPGNDAEIATIGGQKEIVASATGGALATYAVTGAKLQTMQQTAPAGFGPASNATDRSGALNLFEGASIGDLAGTGSPDVVKYELSLNAAANLLLVGQNAPYNHLIGAWDASTGAPVPAYPTITDDYQFLSASDIAHVTAAPDNQIVAGTGLGLLHAYDGISGLDVSGFPKVTGGWLFAPAALSDDGRMADITREGYLFEWQINQPPCQAEWPSYRHDPHSSGNYNHDGTPPATPTPLILTGLGANRYRLTFKAPGDAGFCGSPDSYVARVDDRQANLSLAPPASGGTTVTRELTLPAGAGTLSLQARDADGAGGAGLLGPPCTVSVPRPGAASATCLPPLPSLIGSGSTCITRRQVVIHLSAPRGDPLVSARIYVNRHRVRALHGRRLRAPITLRALPPGGFTLRVVARTRSGRKIISRRHYRPCARRASHRRHRRHRHRHRGQRR